MDASAYACGGLDDLAVALGGMHPTDVWVTRLEAQLPRAALVKDLTLVPSTAGSVFPALQATKGANAPCPLYVPVAAWRLPTGATPAGFFALAFAAIVTRRRRRP
jgi:MYXO-CTERM domain-containing protein